MLFNSLVFLFAFLPVTYAVYWLLRTTAQRHAWLTVTGYVFYGYWDPRYCLLMAFTTLVSYGAGRAMLSVERDVWRRLVAISSVSVDLLLLGYFKYAGFLGQSFNDASGFFGWSAKAPVLSIVLPVGISFYTFHTITYIVDAYRRVITPTRSVWEYGAYVSLFSQLVAGPIVRFREIEKDLESVGSAVRRVLLLPGLSFLAFGMFEKLVIADSLAGFVNPLFEQSSMWSTPTAWLAVFAYSFQLFFDFSGYSTMAYGLGLMFGLRIPQNFNSPYRARNPSDFWTRWHISLSSIMRDYLYIPFGGNRGGEWKRNRNLMLTMLIGGLWHGANWTFVVWGAYHGLLLVAYHRLTALRAKTPILICQFVTFVSVAIGWVFFRAPDLRSAFRILGVMFSTTNLALPAQSVHLIPLVAIAGVLATAAPNAFEFHAQFMESTRSRVLVAIGLGVAVALIARSRESPFLYFQF